MKNLFFLLLCLVAFSCSKKNIQGIYKLEKTPIVDYNQPDEFYKTSHLVEASLEKQRRQTVVIINDKVIQYDAFLKLLNEKRISTLKIIQDSAEISKLNYSYDQVKRVIIGQKK